MSDGKTVQSFDEVQNQVKEIIYEFANVKEAGQMTIDDNFSNFAINSVDFIKIIVGIETKFDFEFYDDDLQMGRFNNMHDLIDYIIERKSTANL